MIEQIVEYNQKFVDNKGYEPYLTSKYPNTQVESLRIHTEVWSEAFWLRFWSLVWSRLWSSDTLTAACREWMEMNC